MRNLCLLRASFCQPPYTNNSLFNNNPANFEVANHRPTHFLHLQVTKLVSARKMSAITTTRNLRVCVVEIEPGDRKGDDKLPVPRKKKAVYEVAVKLK